jgi:choline dehydrogenase-like flavoprotein
LQPLGIKTLVDCPEVGHGVDHMEVAVSYQWLPRWNEKSSGAPPRGGPMAWPIVMFLGDGVMAHFGIAPPPYGGNEVTCTPNCMRPDSTAGFRAEIQSTDANMPIRLTHDNPREDIAVLCRGVRKTVSIFDALQSEQLVGARVQPTDADLADDVALDRWVRGNAGTAYHWMSTCRAGGDTTFVADEEFRVRGVAGLRVGAGAALPELTEANPHLLISAFSIALAHAVLNRDVVCPAKPQSLLQIRSAAEIRPDVENAK